MFDLSPNLEMLVETTFWFVLCFGIFSTLAEFTPNIKGQRVIRKSMKTDLIYWFLMPFLYIRLAGWLLLGLTVLFFGDFASGLAFMEGGLSLFSDLPLLLQMFLILLIMDTLQYWTHRLFHTEGLWSFHAIHHSPKELDWLSGVRFHPVNLVVHSTLTGVIVYALGFSPEAFVLLVPFNILYSAMVHANLNWTFGPLRYVFASPVFHRWHHTAPEEGGEMNFAPTFSFVDIIFGTFYMPKDKFPVKFGVKETVPETFMGQMMYPFRKKDPK